MTKTTKFLLATSLAGFAIGCTDVLWAIGRPIGAIAFGLFLIFKVLEKVSAEYDDEQYVRLALADRHNSLAAKPARTTAAASASPASGPRTDTEESFANEDSPTPFASELNPLLPDARS